MELTNQSITIKTVTEKDLPALWALSYGPDADLEWTKWDGPYFNDPIYSWEDYSTGFGKRICENPHYGLLYYQDKLVGEMAAYWEDGSIQQWLEFGLSLYDMTEWGKGIGTQAVKLWLPYLFDLHPHIQRVGYTTWSGNHGMMQIGEKLGMHQDAFIPQVRVVNDQYYASVKYGLLRTELAKFKANL